MSKSRQSPPRFYSKLFKWFCKDEYYSELQGDLEEEFFENSTTLGTAKANRLYKKEIIKMIRPSVLKRTIINTNMRHSLIIHFFIIGFRNLKRNLPYALLNTVGFAAAIAVCLFCINAIYSNHQLNKNVSDSERIYRINLQSEKLYGPSLSATTQISFYQKAQEALPEAENIGIIQQQFYGGAIDFLKGATRSFSGQGVNEDFFEIFDFKMILGNPSDLFGNPKNIIITEKIMNEYFTEETVIGSTIGQYIISGVIENPAEVSHLDFEFLNSRYEDHTSSDFYSSWKSYNFQQLYLKLRPKTDPAYVQQKLKSLSASINDELNNADEGISYNYILEPLAEVAQSRASFNEGALLNKDGQKGVAILMLIIVILATFNYTNLAMASAITRTKEVGIRKVLGTSKYALVYQLLIETTILCLIGFCFGLLIFKLLAPSVASFTEFAFQEHLSIKQILIFLSFTILTGIISGIIPGLFFSKLSILTLFRKSISRHQFSVGALKKTMVVIQITVSLLVFTLGILIFTQSNLILDQKTPFSGENMVSIDLPSSDSLTTVFRSEISRINGVESIAGVDALPYVNSTRTYRVKKHHIKDDNQFSSAVILNADSGFVSTFSNSIEWLANKEAVKGRPYFLVNESFTKNLSDSLKSFDETTFSIGLDYYPVLGIVKNLNLSGPVDGVDPAAILVEHEYPYTTLLLRLNEASFASTLGQIGEVYKTRYPDFDFHPIFFEDAVASSLNQFKNIINAIIFIFVCIIAITLMGQIGMAMYQARTREKEIGIRKVLGASFSQISGLLLRSTFIQLTIAGVIACPLAYFIFNQVTPEFSIPLVLKPIHFIGAFMVFTFLISALVSSQTWKTASKNPVDSLQNE